MRIYKEFDFDSFQPWSGAVDTYNRIQEEGKGAALETILDLPSDCTVAPNLFAKEILDIPLGEANIPVTVDCFQRKPVLVVHHTMSGES